MVEKAFESRLKKLEERYRDLKDSTEEATSSIEDLYDTLNNIIAPPISESNSKYIDTTISASSNNITSNSICNERKLTKSDIYHFLNRHNILSSEELYKLTEQFGCSLLTNNYITSINKLYELLEYFISKTKEDQIIICNKLANNNLLNTNELIIDRLNTDGINKQDEIAKPKILTILESGLSSYHRKLAISKLEMLEKMDSQDAEYWKLSQWLDNLLAIPFGIYKTPNYLIFNSTDSQTNTLNKTLTSAQTILQSARNKLDTVIYGQQATKSHMLEIIARMISNPTTLGSVFAVEGLPGCGKTTLIKEGFSQILGLPFEFIPLGGANESAYLAGQNYTYIGSTPGKIIQALKQAKCMNPVFYFDELDKISATERGIEVMNLLIHLTDPAQNGHFQDLYMDGITVDLSRAIFVFSFNDRRLVNPILLDRMEIIRFHSYTPTDKAVIIEKHLIPQVMNKYFGNSAKSRIKCIMRNKQEILRTLITPSKTYTMANGKVNKKKVIRARASEISGIRDIRDISICPNRTSGIRIIIRRIEKAIARINLNILESGRDINKIKKIILTARMFGKKYS